MTTATVWNQVWKGIRFKFIVAVCQMRGWFALFRETDHKSAPPPPFNAPIASIEWDGQIVDRISCASPHQLLMEWKKWISVTYRK